MLQTLTISWLTQSLKKMKKLVRKKPKFQQPSTLEPINDNKRSLTTPKFEESKTQNPIAQIFFCETLVFYSLLSLIPLSLNILSFGCPWTLQCCDIFVM